MSVSISNSRRQIAFVRSLVSGKKAVLQKNGIYKIDSNTRCASLCSNQVKKLISDGVLNGTRGEVRANKLSKNWLKRSMAEQSESFSEQHQNIKVDFEGKRVNLNENVLLRLSVSQKGKAPYFQPHHIEAGKRFSRL